MYVNSNWNIKQLFKNRKSISLPFLVSRGYVPFLHIKSQQPSVKFSYFIILTSLPISSTYKYPCVYRGSIGYSRIISQSIISWLATIIPSTILIPHCHMTKFQGLECRHHWETIFLAYYTIQWSFFISKLLPPLSHIWHIWQQLHFLNNCLCFLETTFSWSLPTF